MRTIVLSALLMLSACADPFVESTALISETEDLQGPYTVRSVVIGVEWADRVELFYNVVDDEPENFIPLLMEPPEAGGDSGAYRGELFVAGIPGQKAGSEVLYYVGVTRDGEQVAADPVGGDLRPFVFSVRDPGLP